MKTQPQKQRRKKLRRRPHYPRIFALLAVLAFIFGGVYAQLTVPEEVAAAPSAPQQSARQKTVAEAATRPAPAEEEVPAEEKRIVTLAEAVPNRRHLLRRHGRKRLPWRSLLCMRLQATPFSSKRASFVSISWRMGTLSHHGQLLSEKMPVRSASAAI